MACPTVIWANAATFTAPSAAVQAQGFTCGPADPDVFNWLFNSITECLILANARLDALEQSSGGTGSTGSFGTGTIVDTDTTTSGDTGSGTFGTGTIS